MKVGIFPPFVSPLATPDYIAAVARAAEERGFHSLWAPEHVVLFDEYESQYPYQQDGRIPLGGERGVLDPFDALAFAAAVTSTIRLGTGICLVPQRNPVYTAKQVATVDWLSNGRFDFGVGIGWLREEFEALGAPWQKRAQRTRSYLEVMRRLWCDEVSRYEDEFYALPPTRQYPKPVQRPHPPIIFGGESDPALLRVADIGQGWYGFDLDPERAGQRIRDLTALLEARGRSRAEIEVSVSPYQRQVTPEMVQGYREAGVDQVIIAVGGRTAEQLEQRLDDLARTIVEPARSL